MREIARVQQGYFPTQDRIVQAVSRLFRLQPSSTGTITVLDAGCGTGKAIADLRDILLVSHPKQRISLLGVESDKHRHAQAETLLGKGSVLWAAIEDTRPEGAVSLLWFNPPYDRIRGAGRLETALFGKVKDWAVRGTGLLLMIVPDYVLADANSGLAAAVEKDFDLIGVWRYPEPEYSQFKQCVLLARRRERAEAKTLVGFPSWAVRPQAWPILPDRTSPVAELVPTAGKTVLRRARLTDEILADTIAKSPLRSALLREATTSASPVGRPLLPLKPGHLALALAGGLCDGVIEEKGVRFLVKGTLSRAIVRINTRPQLDENGKPVTVIDTYKTKYAMNVRCLLSSGVIEDYTSADPETTEETDTA